MTKAGRELARALGVVLVLRVALGVGVAARSPAFPTFYDGNDYRELAASVAAGHGFAMATVRWFEAPRPETMTPEAFRPPLLPFLAGSLLAVESDSFERLLGFQGVLAALLAGVVAFLLRDVAGPRGAWAGLVLCAAHPLLVHYSLHFSTEILFTLLLAAFIWAWTCRNRWRPVFLGFTIAMATLTRATAILLLPLSVAALLMSGRDGRRLRDVAGTCLSFFLSMTPWMLRNYEVFGAPRVTSWYGGHIFWAGSNKLNEAAYRASDDRQFLDYQAQAFDATVHLASSLRDPKYRDPGEQEAFWLREAVREIHGYGLRRWLVLLCRKAWHFWRPWPVKGAHDSLSFWIVAVSEVALYVCGSLGMVVLWKRRSPVVVPLVLLLVAGTSAHVLTFAYLRYRVPFVDLAMIICTGALVEVALSSKPVRDADVKATPT